MPLPESSKQPWPPKWWQPFASDIAVASDWYAGDSAQLDGLHGPVTSRSTIGRAWDRLSRNNTDSTQTVEERRIHVPVAADVAATGADLLFSELPVFTMASAHGETKVDAAVETEHHLNALIERDGWSSTLLEGAEICGALGGVFLRPVVDESVVDHPTLTVVHPDLAVPEFMYGHLVAVTFWSSWDGERGKVWRHLERHTRGLIEHGLYLGSVDELGDRRWLDEQERTARYVTDVNALYGGGVEDLAAAGIDRLLPRYIPNALPNRRHRKEPVGRSDTAGVEHLLNALDETWTSWVRDIRLAKARLVVPDEFLDHGGRGQGAAFNMDREIFSPLQMDPASMEKAGITLVQFDIRTNDHDRTSRALYEQIIASAGYSPQSFGMQGNGAAITATEVDAHDGRSAKTTGRKQEYWRRGLADVAETMLILDNIYFDAGVEVERPTVTYPDASENDMRDAAETLNMLALAKSASIETRVRILHPEWEGTEVLAEVERIQSENSTQVSDPFDGVA